MLTDKFIILIPDLVALFLTFQTALGDSLLSKDTLIRLLRKYIENGTIQWDSEKQDLNESAKYIGGELERDMFIKGLFLRLNLPLALTVLGFMLAIANCEKSNTDCPDSLSIIAIIECVFLIISLSTVSYLKKMKTKTIKFRILLPVLCVCVLTNAWIKLEL